MTKKQSHKETKVSSDSVIQNSLEKGIQYLKDTKISNRYTIQQQIEKAINIALADQKQELSKRFTELLMEKQDNILELNKQLADQRQEIITFIDELDKDIEMIDNIQYNLGYEQALKDIKRFIENDLLK